MRAKFYLEAAFLKPLKKFGHPRPQSAFRINRAAVLVAARDLNLLVAVRSTAVQCDFRTNGVDRNGKGKASICVSVVAVCELIVGARFDSRLNRTVPTPMKYEIFSYRYAQEILEHRNNREAWDEIMQVVSAAPMFVSQGKSARNSKLDAVQQCMNTWFDRALAVENDWEYHPLATRIKNSRLAADFRKKFPNITIQAEVQFGNMSRWYSDIFKLQTAYSQSLVHLGLSIVPMGTLARRIDSNVANFERVKRELPFADLSITLPILVIGIEPDDVTPVIDLNDAKIPLTKLTKSDGRSRKSEENRYRIVNAVFSGDDLETVDESSPIGPRPKATVAVPANDVE